MPTLPLKWFLIFGLNLCILGAATAALAAPPQQEPTPEATPPTGETCAECHLDVHAEWLTGAHAIAYDRESFQAAWQQANGDPACLQCHTTNYEPPTGTFLSVNIQCEACHGLTPANHPPEEIVTRTDAGLCRDCHTATFTEFRESKHAFPAEQEALGCATCHNPHAQTLRLESVDALCQDCHETGLDNYVHNQHRSMQTDLFTLNCSSCHMYNSQRDEIHQLADHKMIVDTLPCETCHEEMAATGQFTILANVTAAEERNALRTQAEELEALIAEANAAREAAPPPIQQLLQGLVGGLSIGLAAVSAIVLVTRRRRNGQ